MIRESEPPFAVPPSDCPPPLHRASAWSGDATPPIIEKNNAIRALIQHPGTRHTGGGGANKGRTSAARNDNHESGKCTLRIAGSGTLDGDGGRLGGRGRAEGSRFVSPGGSETSSTTKGAEVCDEKGKAKMKPDALRLTTEYAAGRLAVPHFFGSMLVSNVNTFISKFEVP